MLSVYCKAVWLEGEIALMILGLSILKYPYIWTGQTVYTSNSTVKIHDDVMESYACKLAVAPEVFLTSVVESSSGTIAPDMVLTKWDSHLEYV